MFRYGGDEFVVILEREDYDRRDELMKELAAYSEHAKKNNDNSIAAGMAAFDDKKHTSLHSAFEEADVAMYENKRIMKGIV